MIGTNGLPADRGAEQGDRDGLGVEVDHGHTLAGHVGEERAGPSGPGRQFRHGGAVGHRTDGDALAHANGGHLQEHPDVHGGDYHPDEGRGLASLSTRSSAPIESDAVPPFEQRSSRSSAPST